MLREHPTLAVRRREFPAEGFFAHPYLLWFVAEDPVRADTLPPNIVDMAHAIIAAARTADPSAVQEQLDYALTLVSWSWVAARCGVQLPLIDALIDAGAVPGGNANNALVNGHVAAAERLIARGGALTLASALGIGRWNAVPALAEAATSEERQLAFVLAALNGNAEALRWMITSGVDVNAPSDALYSHGTPLHHAVASGSLEAVRVLVEAGADPGITDTAWGGTPLGWALHYLEERTPRPRAERAAIVEFLTRVVEP